MKGLDIGAGIVDADYRGSVKILLINNFSNIFQINFGDRIAQLILERIENLEYVLVKSLPETNRLNWGFGSTRLSFNSANSADLGCDDPILIPVSIRECKSQQTWTPASALIDSGASTQFIDPTFAHQLGLKLDSKPVPEALILVDR